MTVRTFDHTADIGLEVEAASLPALFAEAARGLRDQIVAAEDVVAEGPAVELRVTASDLAGLLVAWLGELLFRWDAREELFASFPALSIENDELVAQAELARLRAGAELLADIKAVTYHALSLETRGDGWFARVVLDI